MKKVGYTAFGGLEVLQLIETNVPATGPRDVLVRVKAAAVNPVDWKMREGKVKFLTGWRMPQGQGLEFAGVIEGVGRDVTEYAAGDEVFGAAKSCLADYVVAKVAQIAKKPAGVSFEVAATIPVVGTTAASLFARAAIGPGTEVLINGATGGIGMFATQMAVRRGATVTAVVSEKRVALVTGWGVARAVDYHTINVLSERREYDVVVDLSDTLTFRRAKALLKPRGMYVASLPIPAELIAGLLNNVYATKKYALMGMRARTDVLESVASEVAAGRIEVVVGNTFPLEAFRDAYAQASSRAVVGKVVFVMGAWA
jgi:NADPH:quinone reductase-like Zn-dependent oxidoreductase